MADYESFVKSNFTIRGRSGDELRIDCPFCEKKGHFYFNKAKGVGHCFVCNTAVGVHALMKIVGQDGLEEGIYFDYNDGVTKEKKPIDKRLPQEFTRELSAEAKKYLNDRKISDNLIEEYRIGYCEGGKYGGRIIVPIYSGNDLVYYIARTYIDESPKYLNPTNNSFDIGKSGCIFNYDKMKSRDRVVLVEGVFDVFRHSEHCISILGKKLSAYQFKKIMAMDARVVYVALDPDAKSDAIEVCREIAQLKEVRLVVLDGDPGETDPYEFKQRLDSAVKFDFRRSVLEALNKKVRGKNGQ